jgi:hypothetical protein
MYQKLQIQAGASICSAMEAETIQKNAVSPKNHRNRIPFTLFALLVLMMSIFVFSSCENEEDKEKEPDSSIPLNKIEGIVENSTADSIRAVAILNDVTYHIASSAISANGEFSIPLPDLKNAAFLYPITEETLIRSEVHKYISDLSTQMTKLQFYGVKKGGQVIGEFYFADLPTSSPLENIGDTHTSGRFWYFDRTVNIDPVRYNYTSFDVKDMRQGWHTIYYRREVNKAMINPDQSPPAIYSYLFSIPSVNSSFYTVNKDEFKWYFRQYNN